MIDFWPKDMEPLIIANIQKVQDSLASLNNIYMSIFDLNGNPLTIPSNQPYKCLECLNKYPEIPCFPNFNQAISSAYQNKKTVTIQCPYKLLTSFVPLGILSNNFQGNIIAVLSLGRVLISDQSAQDISVKKDRSPYCGSRRSFSELSFATLEKIVATFGDIFDLIFSLAGNEGINVKSSVSTMISSVDSPDIGLLSKRELEVLNLIGLGLSNRAVGEHLFVSESTVKTHIYNISKKLNLTNRTELALFFVNTLQNKKDD